MIRALLAVAAGAAALVVAFGVWQAWPDGRGGTACAAPAHASGLRVWGLGCAEGRRVAVTCARFSEGAAGACGAAGRLWRCTSNRNGGGPESPEACVAGRLRVELVWGD